MFIYITYVTLIFVPQLNHQDLTFKKKKIFVDHESKRKEKEKAWP